MNPFEMVVAIVAIGAVASVIRALLGVPGRMRGSRAERMIQQVAAMQARPDPETDRLRDDVRGLKERVAVLEPLITDPSSSLDREFEKLKSLA